jgi:hypothetical protein
MAPRFEAAYAQLASVRVTGVLVADAHMAPTVGRDPHALLMLRLQPKVGLPYEARIDLGPDVADHMQAEAELPHLRAGVLVSVAGDALELRHDHGHAVLRVLRPRDAVSFSKPNNHKPQEG